VQRQARQQQDTNMTMTSFEDLEAGRSAMAVVGLGYVGLPLAVALARHFRVIGFDVSAERVRELQDNDDRTGEVPTEELARVDVAFTTDPAALHGAGVLIVAVPTPIDQSRSPDLRAIHAASATVGDQLTPGAVVIYESTVYPGLTEEVCVPILEERSGLAFGRDFFVGYSPERVNPGDTMHSLDKIVKVVAGCDGPTLDLLDAIYSRVVSAGICRASSIKVAEAAKVIENTQRDLNIALVNELSLIFERLNIDTQEVLDAAATKWNFLPFKPGLVGGHCIGVDPYYLTFKAESLGLHPQVILAGRRINDSMPPHVAQTALKKMLANGCILQGAKVGFMGITFKENVPDLRNTKAVEVVREIQEYQADVLVHDPVVDPEEARAEHGLELVELDRFHDLEALVICVPHRQFTEIDPQAMKAWFRDPDKAVLLDVKGAFDRRRMLELGFDYWRL
jgi:UDP-N-acetyl-D-galactosamine dehydrogenase